MADNVNINVANNTTATIASEDNGSGTQIQVVKTIFGAPDVQTYISSGTPLPVSEGLGIGSLQSILSGNISGTSLNVPLYYSSVRFYLNSGDLISFSVATSAIGSPAFTIIGQTGGTKWDEPLSNGQNVYIVSAFGNPLYRFL